MVARPAPALPHLPSRASRSAIVVMNGGDSMNNMPPDGWNAELGRPGREVVAHEPRAQRTPGALRPHEPHPQADRGRRVLIFNLGMREGVYTLPREAEVSVAHVLVFALAEDAARFAANLQADGRPPRPPAGRTSSSTLCGSAQFDISLVPPGAPVTPQKDEYDKAAFERIGLGGDETTASTATRPTASASSAASSSPTTARRPTAATSTPTSTTACSSSAPSC